MTATQTQKQALCTKKKYKSITSKLKLGYGSLPNPKRHGRKRTKFRNYIGIRASKLQKVCVYIYIPHSDGIFPLLVIAIALYITVIVSLMIQGIQKCAYPREELHQCCHYIILCNITRQTINVKRKV